MDCQNEKNRQRCNCTYEPCSRKGNCCACVAYHKDMGEFPACFFTNRAERTYDRSFAALVRDRG
ncbi:MAG TPA: DUF6485 family protein [bacterium]|nr:DUF6485 family protein [bacterium]